MAEIKQNLLTKLSNYFGIGYSKTKDERKSLYPIKKVRKNGKDTFQREKFPPNVEKLWDFWQNATHDNPSDFNNRDQLWGDMDTLFHNCPTIAKAMKMVAEEALQADSNVEALGVDAPQEQKDYILQKIKDLGIKDLLYDTALNIAQYGNACWVNSINEDGIEAVLPVSVYDIKDRIEFTPHEVHEQMRQSKSLLQTLSRKKNRISQLIDTVDETKSNEMTYFKSHLFGFQIGDLVVPPWRISHFRNFTTKSPFRPFGVPMFINALAPYRQWDAGMSLQIVARGAQFPIDKYTLNIPSGVMPTDKLDMALDFMLQFDNAGLRDTRKEGIGVGERIMTIKDLFDYDQISPNIDLKGIDDLEMLRDDIFLASDVPRSFLDPNDGGFGATGVSLVQQYKPFARKVYLVQSIMMTEIAQLLKVDMITSGKFALEDIDFQLTMPYPESQTDGDIISGQSDLLGLANEIVDALTEKILGSSDESLPPELIKQIYQQILPYDATRIDDWVKQITDFKAATQAKAEAEAGAEEEGGNSFYEKASKVMKKAGHKLISEMVHEEVFNHKQKRLSEGVLGGKHFFSSNNVHSGFESKKLVEWKKEGVIKLQEESDIREYLKEMREEAAIIQAKEDAEIEAKEEKEQAEAVNLYEEWKDARKPRWRYKKV